MDVLQGGWIKINSGFKKPEIDLNSLLMGDRKYYFQVPTIEGLYFDTDSMICYKFGLNEDDLMNSIEMDYCEPCVFNADLFLFDENDVCVISFDDAMLKLSSIGNRNWYVKLISDNEGIFTFLDEEFG